MTSIHNSSHFSGHLSYTGLDKEDIFCHTEQIDRAAEISQALKNLSQYSLIQEKAKQVGLNPNNLFIALEFETIEGVPASLFISDPEGTKEGISIPFSSFDSYIKETINHIVDGRVPLPNLPEKELPLPIPSIKDRVLSPISHVSHIVPPDRKGDEEQLNLSLPPELEGLSQTKPKDGKEEKLLATIQALRDELNEQNKVLQRYLSKKIDTASLTFDQTLHTLPPSRPAQEDTQSESSTIEKKEERDPPHSRKRHRVQEDSKRSGFHLDPKYLQMREELKKKHQQIVQLEEELRKANDIFQESQKTFQNNGRQLAELNNLLNQRNLRLKQWEEWYQQNFPRTIH